MKKTTCASFCNIPNNEEGMEFMRMFKKYRNRDVIGSYLRRGRKPTDGKHTHSIPLHRAGEFSLYITGFNSDSINTTKANIEIEYWKKNAEHQQNTSDENYKNRCDWRDLYYSLNEMSIIQFICYKFKIWRK
jgi:hypothetical protein|tara:strand:+ start:144 stop:539 length:396 start_codon:yes stop_codon:yes gene_type:complete